MGAATALDTYRQKVAELPEDAIIGQILWFTINAPRVTIEEMRQWFVELGLDEDYLPNPIKPVDAFRSATGDAETRYTLDSNRDARLTIDEVTYDNEKVVQHIIRQTRNKREGRLDHEQVGEAIFYRQSKNAKQKGKGGHRVRFSRKEHRTETADELATLDAFINDVYQRFELFCQFPTANAVRATIRQYILDLNSIAVRPSGGVYFVHKTRKSTVDALQTFVARLENKSTLHTLPLVDTDDQREMLADSFQDEIEKACNSLLAEVAELNAKYGKGKLPPKKYAEANARYQELQDRAREYTDILGLGLDSAATALDTALDSVMSLAERIDHSTTK